MKKIVENIKNQANSDYRGKINGIVCDILDAYQLVGMSATLKVSPVGFNEPQSVTFNQKSYNVLPCGSAGVYGFPTALKEAYYAYVITNDVSMIEGKPAIIIPKSVLLSNPGSDYAIEPNIIAADNLNTMTVRKEDLVVSRKYT